MTRPLYVIILAVWVSYGTYTATAAVFRLPHLAEEPRAVALAGMVIVSFGALLHAFGSRLVGRLAREFQRSIAEAQPPARPPSPDGTGEPLTPTENTAGQLVPNSHAWELGREFGRAEERRRLRNGSEPATPIG